MASIIVLLFSIPLMLLSTVVTILPFLVYALKMKNKLGWLALVPGLNYFAVSSGFEGKFPIFGDFALSSGKTAGLLYLLYILVATVIWAPLATFLIICSLFLLTLPVILISYAIAAIGWILVYALLRNISDRHSENTSTNTIVALGLVLLDLFVTRGFAWPIYIFIMAFMPVVEPTIESAAEPAAVAE